MTLPVAPIAGLAAGLYDPVYHMLHGNPTEGFAHLCWQYTGYDPTMNNTFQSAITGLSRGVLPLVAGALVHKFVGGTLGVNRALARAKVPFVRL